MAKISTTQLRASIPVDTDLLLRLMSEKRKVHIGKIIQTLLEESETFKEAQKKLKNFSDDF